MAPAYKLKVHFQRLRRVFKPPPPRSKAGMPRLRRVFRPPPPRSNAPLIPSKGRLPPPSKAWKARRPRHNLPWPLLPQRRTPSSSYERFERMCTNTNLLLAHHMRQAHYTWRQQEHIMNLTQGFNNSCQQKTTLYWDASRQARQTIYLIRKRPREQWDPTLWEVPLQPLPKRHKAHWDPNEWKIPLT